MKLVSAKSGIRLIIAASIMALVCPVLFSCRKEQPKTPDEGRKLLETGVEKLDQALKRMETENNSLQAKDEVKAAIDILYQAAKAMPESPKPLVEIGRGLESIGEPEAAISQYEKAYQLNDRDMDFISKLAGLYIQNNRPRNAADILIPLVSLTDSGAVENTQQPPEIYFLAAEALIGTGKNEKAAVLYEFIIQHGENIDTWREWVDKARARLQEITGGSQNAPESDPEAERLLNEGIALVDKALQDFQKNGDAKAQEQTLLDAMKLFDQAISIDPNYARPHAGKGSVLRILGRYDEALANYEKAIALNPDYPVALYNMALCYKEKNEIDKADEYFQKSIELNPLFPNALVDYANFLEARGKNEEAAKHYRKAVDLNPKPDSVGRDFAAEAEQGLERLKK